MNSICFFSSYFNEPAIPYYIKFYLENLTPYFNEIVFITNDKQLDIESKNFFVEKNIKLNYVVNEGWDFGMWYKAFQIYDIKNYDRIGLVNDSCILFMKPDGFFDWLDKNDYDYCGMVDSNAVSYHLQSFFLIINKKAVPHVYNYFMQQGIVKDVKDVIKIYEIGLCKYLLQEGLKLGACYSISDYFGEYSPTYYFSEKLILKGLPLIKKKILLCSFRKNELFTLARMKFIFNPKHHINYIKQLYQFENSNLINFRMIQDQNYTVSLFLKVQCIRIASFFFQIIRSFRIKFILL
jgi:lipopolysaccharide biosynthesis protein